MGILDIPILQESEELDAFYDLAQPDDVIEHRFEKIDNDDSIFRMNFIIRDAVVDQIRHVGPSFIITKEDLDHLTLLHEERVSQHLKEMEANSQPTRDPV